MTQLFQRTDKAFIQTLPIFNYPGEIVLVNCISEVKRAVNHLRRSKILGIDTETRPSFRKGIRYKVALLQISDGKICFLFRLNKIGFPNELADLLADGEIVKVGLSLKDDFASLRKRRHFLPNACVDLQNYVKPMGIEDMSLQKLFANVFRQKISKSNRLTNWEAPILTPAQQTYAAIDAHVCVMLYNELKNLQLNNNYELIKTEITA